MPGYIALGLDVLARVVSLPSSRMVRGLSSRGPEASACRGRTRRAARPRPRPPPPAPPFSGSAPARSGPSSLSAQPPPKPGEGESRRRRSLRGTGGAALGMLSRRSPSWSQVGSSCAAPAADPGAPGRARLEQSCRAPELRRAPRTAGEPRSLACFCSGSRGGPGVLGREPIRSSGVGRVAARSPGGCSSSRGPEGSAATATRPAAATASAAGVCRGVSRARSRAAGPGGLTP